VSYGSPDEAKKKLAKMPVVFVISPDWTLRTMVRAELREAGIMALGMQTTGDLEEVLDRGVVPSSIVLDGVELEDLKAQKMLETLTQDVPVLVVDSTITPAPHLPGAEVLHRPVQVRDVVSRVLARLSE
jgi:hypothetical protein